MSLAVHYSRAPNGVQAPLVTVEVHLANGLPSLSIVGYINPYFNLLIYMGFDAYRGYSAISRLRTAGFMGG